MADFCHFVLLRGKGGRSSGRGKCPLIPPPFRHRPTNSNLALIPNCPWYECIYRNNPVEWWQVTFSLQHLCFLFWNQDHSWQFGLTPTLFILPPPFLWRHPFNWKFPTPTFLQLVLHLFIYFWYIKSCILNTNFVHLSPITQWVSCIGTNAILIVVFSGYWRFSRRGTHPVRAPSRAPCWIFWNNKICFNFVSILFEKIKLTVSERTYIIVPMV